ncbi:MAG: M28 family peptidase [Balneolaceae bacterium]|nr:M28 family peptidase [Balneolaceae bacterium]
MECSSPQKEITLNTDQLIADIEYLSSDKLEGRLVGTPGSEKARAFLVQRYEEIGAQPFKSALEHPFTFERRGEELTGINVIGSIAGKTDSVILITAHYDHLGIRDSLIYNGADDNASGTAGLLAMMDYFSKVEPNHTMVFATLDAEEGGLNGAVALASDSTFLERVVLNINMDMIAQNEKNELYAVGTYHFPQFKPVLESVETGEISLLFGHDRPEDGNQDWTYASDHGAFFRQGVPFIYFGVEDHEHYHRATDEFETIPQEFYKKSAQVILNAVLAIDEHLFN